MEDLADGIRVVAVVVYVLGKNLAMGDADFFPPCFLCRPFYVGEDNDRAEVAVYPHSIPQRFCSKRYHAIDVGDDRLPSIEIFPAMLTNCRLMFVASGISAPSVIAVKS